MIKTLRISMLALFAVIYGATFAQEKTATFDWTGTTGGLQEEQIVYTQEDITMTFDRAEGQNAPKEASGHFRFYGKNELTIAATAEYKISAVKFLVTGTTYAGKLEHNGSSISDSWTLSVPEQEVKVLATEQVRFSKIVVTYIPASAATKESANIGYAAKELYAELGKNVEELTLSNPNNLPVTYTSSDETVATVAADGTLTTLALGRTTIEVQFAGDDAYYPASASYTLIVQEASTATRSVFDWTSVTTTQADLTEANCYTKENITLTFDKGNGSGFPLENKAGEIRMYKDTELTISAAAGYKITSVEFTPTGATYSAEKLTYEGVAISDEWTLNAPAQEVKLAASDNARFKKIVVNCVEASSITQESAGLAFAQTEYVAEFGAAFESPLLTNPNNLPVTYTSSNEEVATVAADGTVTLVGAGATVIAAAFAGNDNYFAATVSYTLSVVLSEVTLPYTESFAEGIGSFAIDNVSLGEGISYVWKHDATNKYMKASAYNKKAIASEAWLVSPKINLENDQDDVTLTFDQWINYFTTPAEEIKLKVYDVNGNGTWNDVVISYPTETKSWETATVSLKAYAGKTIKLAFVYTSTEASAGTWEIKNLSIVSGTVGIDAVEAADAEEVIFDLAGRRVAKAEKGVYIINGKKVLVK